MAKKSSQEQSPALQVGQPVQYYPNGFEHITGRHCACCAGGNYEVIVSHPYGNTVSFATRTAGTVAAKDTAYIKALD